MAFLLHSDLHSLDELSSAHLFPKAHRLRIRRGSLDFDVIDAALPEPFLDGCVQPLPDSSSLVLLLDGNVADFSDQSL